MSDGQWKTLFGVVAAVCAFALASDLHPDFVLGPAISFALGCVLVGLAALNPNQSGGE